MKQVLNTAVGVMVLAFAAGAGLLLALMLFEFVGASLLHHAPFKEATMLTAQSTNSVATTNRITKPN